MSDDEFDRYLALLGGMLRLRIGQKERLAEELRDHLVEHVAHLESQGVAHGEAVRRALAEFGDAAALAANFQALVHLRRRRLIMRVTMGSMLFVGCAALAVLALRPNVPGDGGKVVAQAPGEEGPKGGPVGIAASGGAKGSLSAEAENDIARGKLKKKLDVELDEIPLREALSWIGTQTKTQFHLDKNALAGADMTDDAQVTLRLKGISAEMALDLIFRSLGLGYTFREGVIIVTTWEKLDEQLETRVYTVPADAAEEIREVVMSIVTPTTWDQNGGAGSIQVFRDSLLVSQSPNVQPEVTKWIEELAAIAQRSPANQAAKEQYPGYSRGRNPYSYPGAGRGRDPDSYPGTRPGPGGRGYPPRSRADGGGQAPGSGSPSGGDSAPGVGGPGGSTGAGSGSVETDDGRVLPGGSLGSGASGPKGAAGGGATGTGSADGGEGSLSGSEGAGDGAKGGADAGGGAAGAGGGRR